MLLTAYHVFNEGKARDPKDKFYAIIVPQNGEKAYNFPVVRFPFESLELDLTVKRKGPALARPVTQGKEAKA